MSGHKRGEKNKIEVDLIIFLSYDVCRGKACVFGHKQKTKRTHYQSFNFIIAKENIVSVELFSKGVSNKLKIQCFNLFDVKKKHDIG